MKIGEVIQDLVNAKVIGDAEQQIANVQSDSRAVTTGSLFIAVKGHTVDGHTFIDKAVDRGAICIVVEHLMRQVKQEVSWIVVEKTTQVLALIASKFYGYPANKLTMVGVTGTNGKTTIATLLYRLFTELGYTCGLLSTVENRIG